MIELVINSRRRSLGGFDVNRVLPYPQRRMVGPFIFFDHMGPVDFPPQIPRSADVRPHPHIGLATVTYLFSGEIVHRDSVGVTQIIRPGEVNWMTAGRGISHSERFDSLRDSGGRLEGIQSWVALPLEHEDTAPAFVHFDAADMPRAERDGVVLQVIAGHAFGLSSHVPTHSPLFYVHAELQTHAHIDMPTDYSERAIYIVHGSVRVDGQDYTQGQLLVLKTASACQLSATGATTLMLLGGESVGPRHIWWNFVASTRERMEQAKDDWRNGRIPLPPHDAEEFIPLPED